MLGSLFPTFLLAAAENDWLARWQETATVISPDDTWGLWGIILTGTALAIYLEQKFRWAAKVSGPVLALIAAMVMSNLKIMPTESEAYGLVSTYLVPIAIPLLLLRADAMRIIRETGWMFLAFHLSCLGTIIGAVVATIIFHGQIEQTPEIAGIMTGSYSGGSVNFFACRESFDVSEGLTNPLLVADNFIMAGMFAVLLVFSGSRFFLKRYSHAYSANTDKKSGDSLAAEYWSRKGVGLLDIAKAIHPDLVK